MFQAAVAFLAWSIVILHATKHVLRTDDNDTINFFIKLIKCVFQRFCETFAGILHNTIIVLSLVFCATQVVDATPLAEPLYLALQYIASGSLHDVLYAPRHLALRSDGERLPLRAPLRSTEERQ